MRIALEVRSPILTHRESNGTCGRHRGFEVHHESLRRTDASNKNLHCERLTWRMSVPTQAIYAPVSSREGLPRLSAQGGRLGVNECPGPACARGLHGRTPFVDFLRSRAGGSRE